MRVTTVSVLVPFYNGDLVDWFLRTLRTVEAQTRPPDEVVVVVDGPVSARHEQALDAAEELFGNRLVIARLDVNRGLSAALASGFARCSGDHIARIDADDLMAPDRLARQLALLDSGRFDVVGSYIAEFDAETDRILGLRQLPVGTDRVRRAAQMVNPMAAPATTWRAATLAGVGEVRDIPGAEDYDLVVRALRAGARITNVPEPLTFYRSGRAMYRRRGGRRVMRGEWRLQHEFLESHFVTRLQFARNVALRGGFYVLPWWLKKLYKEWTLAAMPDGTMLPG
jgi:glycosyltransferase involved in cell wall biosynthesis